ncbi:MAG: hypothetical protein ABFS32_23540 [Bacteroidota bacterium]
MYKKFTCSILAISALLAINGCGGGGGGETTEPITEPTTYNYHGTQNPGDYWTFSFTDGNFISTNVTMDLNISGTTKELTGNSEGFTELTTIGDEKGYALVIPGVGLYAAQAPFEWVDHSLSGEPEDLQYLSKNPIISAISKDASCDYINSNMPFDFVTIQTPNAEWDSRVDWAAGSGTITFNDASSRYDINGSHYSLDGSVFNSFNFSADCVDGVILVDVGESEPLRLSLSTSGGYFVDDPKRGAIVGFKSDSNVTASDVYGMSLLSMRFHPDYGYADMTSSPETQPLKATIAVNGESVNVTHFKDIANGVMDESFDMPISFDEQLVPGMIKGTITDADGTHDAIWIVRMLAGKYQIIQISDNWPSYSGYNVFMIEK